MAEVTELRQHHHSADNNTSSTTAPTAAAAASSAAGKKHHHHHHRHQLMATSVSAASGVGGTIAVEPGTTTGLPVLVDGVRPVLVQVPLHRDTMTFEGRQASRLREMEKRIESEMKRKKREWEKEVERMREEFLELYPTDRVWGSEEMLNDPLVARRCGSTDILDAKKMKTLFMDYPDSGRRYKIRFNVAGCDPKSVRVSTDGDRIVVRAIRYVALPGGAGGQDDSASCRSGDVGREYCRKIQKPKDVDQSKFKAYLTSDSILVVEAPVPPSLNLRKAIQSPSHSHTGSTHTRSPSGSPAAGIGGDTPSKEKIGVPIFRDENGRRRLHLVVDLGTTFQPHDITVQVIKDNKIQIRAKHEEKTIERLCKSKFAKEYELGEKIETLSLTGGLSADGRLYVGAYAKAQTDGTATKSTSSAPVSGIEASGNNNAQTVDGTGTQQAVDDDEPSLKPCNVLTASSSLTAVAK